MEEFRTVCNINNCNVRKTYCSVFIFSILWYEKYTVLWTGKDCWNTWKAIYRIEKPKSDTTTWQHLPKCCFINPINHNGVRMWNPSSHYIFTRFGSIRFSFVSINTAFLTWCSWSLTYDRFIVLKPEGFYQDAIWKYPEH